MEKSQVQVVHNTAQNRWEVKIKDVLAFAEYKKKGNTYLFVHTEVPESMQGKGIASALVKKAFADIREEGATFKAYCTFVQNYSNRHPEYDDLKVN